VSIREASPLSCARELAKSDIPRALGFLIDAVRDLENRVYGDDPEPNGGADFDAIRNAASNIATALESLLQHKFVSASRAKHTPDECLEAIQEALAAIAEALP